jgi:hypothetical protein
MTLSIGCSEHASRWLTMQPHPMTPVMQMGITFAALVIAASAAYFAYFNANEARNAALVSIGVAVLRADPTKEPQARAAREWALDLIDANAGGVKFSNSARAALLEGRLEFGVFTPGYDSTFTPGFDSTFTPGSPAPRDPTQRPR